MKQLLIISTVLGLVCTPMVSSSQITFRHVYGGTGEDHGRAIQQTPDGGYVITGSTGSFGNGASDVYLFKIDSMGILQWSQTYGGSNVDWGQDIKVLPDSGYIITGYTNSFGNGGYDVYLLRTDSLGDTLWTRTYGGTDWDFGYKVIHTSDNGFAIVGETQSYGAADKNVYLIKTDENGDTLWTRTYGGDSVDVGYGIVENLFGGYFIAGKTKSYGAGKEDIYLIRTNDQGDTIFTKTYGGAELDIANGIIQAADSNIVFLGKTQSFGGGMNDMYLIKADTLGDTIWTKTYGGVNEDIGTSISKAWDNGFILLGQTNGAGAGLMDFQIFKVNPNGVFQFGGTYGGGSNDFGYSVDTIGNEFIFMGTTESFGSGFTDVLIVKTDINGDAFTPIDTFPLPVNISYFPNETTNEVIIYPNPVINNSLFIEIKNDESINEISAFDALGRVIQLNVYKVSETKLKVVFSSKKGYNFAILKVRKNNEIQVKKIIFK